MHTYKYINWEYVRVMLTYRIYEHKSILMHNPPVNIDVVLDIVLCFPPAIGFYSHERKCIPANGFSCHMYHAFTHLCLFSCLYNYTDVTLEKAARNLFISSMAGTTAAVEMKSVQWAEFMKAL